MRQSANKGRRAFIATALAMLGATMVFGAPVQAQTVKAKAPAKRETATFAAGCFWSMEAIFKQLKGVDKAEPGYAGGRTANPSYEQVETGKTGHAETVNITFDPAVISYSKLVEVLLTVRDPTTKDQQGPDEGPQYRSIIFYRSAAQRAAADQMIQKITAAHLWPHAIVTTVEPYSKFYPAEGYHHDYYRLHPNEPYTAHVVAPEIAEFRHKFKPLLKQ